MKKTALIAAAILAALALSGCSGNNPSLEANNNKYEILSFSRMINVNMVYNTNSTITNEKENGL